jgi:Fe2+ transport system protein FeoA
MTTLSNAIPGVYKFVAINCDKKLCHRLFEMGFILGKKLSVISTNTRGIIIIVKGAKIVLSNKIAEKIILKKE